MHEYIPSMNSLSSMPLSHRLKYPTPSCTDEPSDTRLNRPFPFILSLPGWWPPVIRAALYLVSR